MLVLTRKNGETVCISREIEVKVLSIGRNVVKLGFSAPPQVDIRRQELLPTGRETRGKNKTSAFAGRRECAASCAVYS
jgi:carbon storage regulator CsrA